MKPICRVCRNEMEKMYSGGSPFCEHCPEREIRKYYKTGKISKDKANPWVRQEYIG